MVARKAGAVAWPPIFLSDASITARVSATAKRGEVVKIGPRLYTSLVAESPERDPCRRASPSRTWRPLFPRRHPDRASSPSPNAPKRRPKHLQLKIWLDEIEPQIWRRVLVSAEMSLHELHRIIQMLFEWYEYQLYEFTIGDLRYQEPGPEAEDKPKDSTCARLRNLGLAVGDEFTYLYDFGDYWVHRIQVEAAPENVDKGWLPFVLGSSVADLRRTMAAPTASSGSWRRFATAPTRSMMTT